MAEPSSLSRLHRCLARLEQLSASWEGCNGKPDHHREDESEALFEATYILPTKLLFLERKEKYIRDKLIESKDLLESVHAKMSQVCFDGKEWDVLSQERQAVFDEHQRWSDELSSVLGEIARSRETSEKALERNLEILAERHELEWLGRVLDHIEPA